MPVYHRTRRAHASRDRRSQFQIHSELPERYGDKPTRVVDGDLSPRFPVVLRVPGAREVLHDASRLACMDVERSLEVAGFVERLKSHPLADVMLNIPVDRGAN